MPLLAKGEPESAGVIHGAIELFAQEFAGVIGRFLKLKHWKDAERIVVGGGFSGSRVGELAIGRASVILKTEKIKSEISIIRNDPDEAGLIGAVHLAPTWMFEAHNAILAIDIGGTNIRTGVVRFNLEGPADIAKAKVWKYELWRHCDEKLTRDEAVEGLVRMLKRLINRAKRAELRLAPFIGIGCPGKIEFDGSRQIPGTQNLPGNWESNRFNLPRQLGEAIRGQDRRARAHSSTRTAPSARSRSPTHRPFWRGPFYGCEHPFDASPGGIALLLHSPRTSDGCWQARDYDFAWGHIACKTGAFSRLVPG